MEDRCSFCRVKGLNYEDVDKKEPVFNPMESFEKVTEGPSFVRATQKKIHLSSSRKSEKSLGLISKDP